MLQKVNNSFNIMAIMATVLILVGFGAFYYWPLIFVPILGIVSIIIVSKKRRDFIENYNLYNCIEEEGSIIPDKFVKFLYYGKNHLYFTNIAQCNIIPYDGLEIEKATSRTIHLINRKSYKVGKDGYKKMKLDISLIEMDNFESYFLNNIAEAKNMDIGDLDFQRNIAEREEKQKTLSPTKMFILLAGNTCGVLIPVAIVANFNESAAVGVLIATLIPATIITIKMTISYIKKLFQYKRELQKSDASIPRFYRTYLKLAFLPTAMVLFLWFIAVVMAADVWFDTWLF